MGISYYNYSNEPPEQYSSGGPKSQLERTSCQNSVGNYLGSYIIGFRVEGLGCRRLGAEGLRDTGFRGFRGLDYMAS